MIYNDGNIRVRVIEKNKDGVLLETVYAARRIERTEGGILLHFDPTEVEKELNMDDGYPILLEDKKYACVSLMLFVEVI